MRKDPKYYFHLLSYLQYPFAAVAFYYIFILGNTPETESIDVRKAIELQIFNKFLLFCGIAISFTSLQDPSRLQIKSTKRLWQKRKFGIAYLAIIFIAAIFFISIGRYGLYASKDNSLSETSLGVIVFGIGILTNLPLAIAIYENHRTKTS